MLIKACSDRSDDLARLEALLTHPHVRPQTRSDIELEIRKIRAGLKGESDAAYEIDFHHRDSDKWAIVHDLRLEWQGRVAQIDHLLINRWLNVWVCESKSFGQGIAINAQGEFVRFHNRSAIGIPSPLEQNRKHVAVLKSVLESSAFQLPTRMGVTLKPTYESVVLIANGARITRADPKLPGMDRVVHTDQFRTLIERSVDELSALNVFGAALKIVSADTLADLARRLAAMHRPIVFDWAARFGLARSDVPVPAEPEIPAASKRNVAADPVPMTDPTPSDALTPMPPAELPEGSTVRAEDPHSGRLSTSKLAAARRQSTQQMLTSLSEAGYLSASGDGRRLTGKALAAGAVHVEKSRYEPYFLWPVDLPIGPAR